MQKIAIVFPPCHDNFMPHISTPLLGAYLAFACEADVKVVDINNIFYQTIIGKDTILFLKNEVKKYLNNGDLVNSILSMIKSLEIYDDKLAMLQENEKDMYVSIRKYSPSFNYKESHYINEYLQQPDIFWNSFFNNIISDLIGQIDILGISISVEDQLIPSFALAMVYKKLYPASKVVLGGSIVTRLFSEIANSSLAKYIDYLIWKEGEVPFSFLINEIYNGKSLPLFDNNVMNLKEIRTDAIQYFIMPKGPAVDINTLPIPSFAMLPLEYYFSPEAIVPISFSRRCYYNKCDFCAIHSSWQDVSREKKYAKIKNELFHYYDEGFSKFRIIDESCSHSVINKLIDIIDRYSLNIEFEIYARLEEFFRDDVFTKKLFASGCRQIYFGLESIGERTLKMVNKGTCYCYENITQCLRSLSKNGIHNSLFVLMGIPNTPIEEELQTIDYIKNNHDIHSVCIGKFLVDKLSPIHIDLAKQNKYNIDTHNIGDFTTEIGFTSNDYHDQDVNGRMLINLSELFFQRPDLALNSLLNEEQRFLLISKFGNNYAELFSSRLSDEEKTKLVNSALKKSYQEKIARDLKSKGDLL